MMQLNKKISIVQYSRNRYHSEVVDYRINKNQNLKVSSSKQSHPVWRVVIQLWGGPTLSPPGSPTVLNIVETENRKMAANPSGQGFQNKNRSCNLGRTGQREKKITKAELIINNSSSRQRSALRPSIRTSRIVLSSSSTLRHALSSGHFKTQDYLRISFFPLCLTLTQNEEHTCSVSDFIISNAKATIIQCDTNYDSEFGQPFKFRASLKERYM